MMTTSVSFMFASRRIDYGLLRVQSAFRQGFLPLMLPYAQFGVSGVPLPEVSSPAGFFAGALMTLAASSIIGQAAISRNRLILVVYTLAIFVSALLLFSVQPLF